MAKNKQNRDLQDPAAATHGDLNIWGGKIQEDVQEVRGEVQEVREEVKEVKQQVNRLEGKVDRLEGKVDKILDHIDVAVEIQAEKLLGVKHDEVREVQRKVKDHEERITVLER